MTGSLAFGVFGWLRSLVVLVARIGSRQVERLGRRRALALWGVGLEDHVAASLGRAIGDEGVNVFVFVVEPFRMVEDEVAVDQIVENQRAFLGVTGAFDLVFDLDVVVVALIDPGEIALVEIGVAGLFAYAPSLTDLLE